MPGAVPMPDRARVRRAIECRTIMRWLTAAAGSIVCFTFVALGTFVPLRDAAGIEYIFVAPTAGALLTVSAIAVFALAALYASVSAVVARRAPDSIVEARSGRWLAPVTGVAALALGILPAVPGVGDHASPAAYFLYDLRWWWIAALGAWTAVRLDQLIGNPLAGRVRRIRHWSPASRLLLMDALLFAVAITWAIVTTPLLRFDGVILGDEPKYFRFCEIWYQGGGLDISQKALFADEPLDAPPRVLKTAGLLVRGIFDDARELTSDLRAFAARPLSFRWNRAKGGSNFVAGKHGGIYQVHQPGLSAVLFPAYFLDRYLFGLQRGHQGEFPFELVMSNVLMLLIYGACAVAMFRLLRNVLGSDALAAIWAAIALLMLPMTAFAFQFYPELPALLVVLLVSNYVLFHAPASGRAAAAAAGAAATGIVWFHPRFLLVSLCLTIAGFVTTRAAMRTTFAAAATVMLLTVGAYDYHVTGSWLPTAIWDANDVVTMNVAGVPLNLIAYLFHPRWGVLPHAPVLLLALPGLFVLARSSMRQAMFIAVMGFALGVPAAGHTLTAAGTTPGRLVVAVVPLFIVPVAILVRRFWSSPAMRVTAAFLVLLSLDAAVAYNRSHIKPVGVLRDPSLSGWKPNLAFPFVRDDVWGASRANFILFLAFIGALAGCSIWALVRARRSRVPPIPQRWWVPAGIAVLFIGISTAATAANGSWVSHDYLIDAARAHRDAARALVALDRCRLCFTSRSTAIDWTRLDPNPARALRVDVAVRHRVARVHTSIEGDGRSASFGRVRIDFGDRTVTPAIGIVDDHHFEHTYGSAGTYSLVVWLQLRDGTVRIDRRSVTVTDEG